MPSVKSEGQKPREDVDCGGRPRAEIYLSPNTDRLEAVAKYCNTGKAAKHCVP